MCVASRWLDETWFPTIVRDFFGFVPGIVRGFASNGARNQMERTYELHRLGRHSLEEQKGFARRDLQAIADAVLQTGYIVGGRLTVYDFTVAGLLSGLMGNEPATWISEIANGYPSLKEYVSRVESEVGVYGK